MPRDRDTEPLFDRVIEEVEKAKAQWKLDNRGYAEALLRAAADIAYAEAIPLERK